ncbi:hypothetical protein A4X06_0g3776 [Tilletia controversa]|uniref:GAR domain-containing protein n=1 Tax=Tilletia controversa TaxID=13291 RepID=A0A8X7SXU8_9BASI|nr:hypothetical protein CF328_g531 [Tilletia controversa]KAE8248354.1 hypothetical protein A4X06_0g3776 [Tilletia controversa]
MDEAHLQADPSQKQIASVTADILVAVQGLLHEVRYSAASSMDSQVTLRTESEGSTSSKDMSEAPPINVELGGQDEAVGSAAGDNNGDVSAPVPDNDEGDTSTGSVDKKQSFSTDELVELRQFNEKKEQIEEQYKLLQSRPMPETFSTLQPMRSEAIVDATFAEFPARKEQLQAWVAEHERIETDAVAFNVADMNKLRTLAKAAVGRHMSPQDTDIIELTVETLVVLDRLLALLNERRRQLDLLAARMDWEERRAACWKAFHPLMNDIDLFVEVRARWTAAAYSRSAEALGNDPAAPSLISPGPSTEDSLNEHQSAAVSDPTLPGPSEGEQVRFLEALNAELNALSSRVRKIVTRLVPAAAEALDGLIDQCQVPEPYLVEQEKLENMALDITARAVFVTSLAAQWRKANELYLATKSLHEEAKDLVADSETIRMQVPTRALYDKMAKSSAAMTAKLEQLAGPSAPRFVNNPSQSAHSLAFSSANQLPTPLHDAWPDQAHQNSLVATHLNHDLATAAKRTRQAAMTVQTYSLGLAAAERAEVLKQQLQHTMQTCEQLRSLAVEGFNPGPGTSASNNADAGTRPDLSSADCLLPSRHSLYVRRLPEEQQKATRITTDANELVQELESCLATCARHGLSHASIKQTGELAMASYRSASEKAAEALLEGSELVALLQQGRTINSSTARLQTNAGQLRGELDIAARSAAFSPKGKGWDVTVAPRFTSAEAKERLQQCTKELEQVNAQASAFDAMPRSKMATGLREKLDSDRSKMAKQVDELRALVTWYTSLCQQEAGVRSLNRQMGSLRKQAAEIKDRSLSNRSGPPDLPALQSAKADFDQTVQKFERKAATGTVFTGDPPEKTEEDVEEVVTPLVFARHARGASLDTASKSPLISHDEEVRECVNGWCTDAKALQEQIASAIASVKQEAARIKPIAEASNKRNMRFDAAVNAALEAVQELSEEVDKRSSEFNELMSTSGSFGDLRVCRDESREALMTKEKALGARMDALRECQREMISSLYSTGKPVMGDSDATSTASAMKVRNTAASTLKKMRQTLATFENQIIHSSAARRTASSSSSKTEVAADESIGDVSQDVFGPRQPTVLARLSSIIPVVDYDELVQTLRNDQLDAQTVEDGQPQLEALLDLPEPSQDRSIQTWWTTIRSDLNEHLQSSRNSSGARRLASAVKKRERSVMRHHQLMQFRSKATELEQMSSSLLNMLDFNGGRSTSSSMENLSARSSRAASPYLTGLDQIESLQRRLRQSVEQLAAVAEPTTGDRRVVRRLQQLTQAAKDILADAKDFGQTPTVPSAGVLNAFEDMDDTESVASTLSSGPSSLASVQEEEQSVPAPAPVKKQPKATPTHARRPSNLVANGMPSTPVNPPARRTVSDQTPGSSKLPSRLRRLKSSIVQPSTPRLSTPKVQPSPRVGPSKLPVRTPSSEYKRKAFETPGTTSATTPATTPATAPVARYRANPKSKLDVAVGKIVNHLPLPVKISHASAGPDGRKQEAYKDESGRYWIGDPEPKLCFCRILRSRTVMVRVGGGWQELSSYVMQHYSHLTAASVAFPISPGLKRSPPGVSPRSVRLNTTELPWISSATLTRSATLEVPPVVLTPADEDRKPRYSSVDSDMIGTLRPLGVMASRASTPALSVSRSTSPGVSPASSTPAIFDAPGAMQPQRLRRVRGNYSRQSLDTNVFMPRHSGDHSVSTIRRSPSPNTLNQTASPGMSGTASPGSRSPLFIRKGSLGPTITPQRPMFDVGTSSPEGILPLFIRKEKSLTPFRSVSGSSRT